jgi:hypothetical protein
MVSARACIILFLATSFSAVSQELSFSRFNYHREEINRKGMLALGSWATANIAVSTPLAFTTDNQWSYFNQMNIYWNLANLGIAVAGYLGAKKNRGKTFDPFTTFEMQKASERIYLFNSGLDIAYMTTGLFLAELSNRVDGKNGEDILKGFGNSMILQGGFLLVFDIVMYLKHKNHGKQNIPKLFEKMEFSSSSVKVRLN